MSVHDSFHNRLFSHVNGYLFDRHGKIKERILDITGTSSKEEVRIISEFNSAWNILLCLSLNLTIQIKTN